MPENEPNQTISKVYGRLIPSDQLPLSNDRVIQYTPSCCSLPFESKNANELLDYVVDMMQWLEPNEQIIGVAGWCDPDSLIMTRLEYASTGVVAWLAGGGDDVRQTVNLQISTNLGRVKLFQFIVHTVGLYDSLAFVIAQDAAVIVGDNSGGGVTPDPEPLINVYPNTFEFPDTSTIIGQSSQTFIVKNDGDATAFIRAISLTGPFTQYNAGITKLDPGAFIQITVTYKPITLGDHTGAISIDIGEGLTQHATFTGTGVSGSRLQTSGNQIVRPGVGNVKLKSINSPLPYVFGLMPIHWQNIGDDAQFVLNQDGTDYIISVTDLKNAVNERTFEAGFVFFFAEDIDPNTKFPGQTWVLVPGVGKTIRLAAADGSDILNQTDSTTVSVTTGSGNNVLSQIATIALIAWYRVS